MKVYVSSTSVDLEKYREAVRTAILRLGHHPVCMEDYVAGDIWPAEKCLRDVASCNAYVGVFAWRYGYVPPNCQVSVTEMELRKAQEMRIPVLAFLLDERVQDWPTEYRDTGPDGEQIVALRQELQRDKLTSFFVNPDDLCARVTASLAQVQSGGQPIVNTCFADTHGFQDRVEPVEELRTILRQAEAKLVCVVGRRDVGKTWLVSKVAREIEKCELRLSETASHIGANGIIYINCVPVGPTLGRVFEYVGKALGSPHQEDLQECWRDESRSTADKVGILLNRLQDGCYLLLFDQFEVMLTADQSHIADHDLRVFFEECLTQPSTLHILTNGRRVPIFAPEIEGRIGHGRRKLPLSQGLPPEDAVLVLRELGSDSQLQDASDEQLLEIARCCDHLPGLFVKFIGIMKQEPIEPLSHFMEDPELLTRLTEDPSRLTYEHLSFEKRLILQALATYGTKVELAALQAALPEVGDRLRTLLNELVISYVVDLGYVADAGSEGRGDSKRALFSLTSSDAHYAYSQIPRRLSLAQRLPWVPRRPLTQKRLHLRAAQHDEPGTKKPEDCRSREDLEPHLRKFEHLVQAAEYDRAYRLLEQFAFPCLWVWGHDDEVVELHERVVGHLSDFELQHLCLGNLGLAYLSVIRPGEAIKSLEQAIRLATLRQDRRPLSRYLGNLALAHEVFGEFGRSVDLLKHSLIIDSELHDVLAEGTHRGDLASIYCCLGQMDEARRCCEQGLSLLRQVQDRRVEANQMALLGLLLLLQGEVDEAESRFEAGWRVAADAESAAGLFHNHYRLAYCSLRKGKARAALEESTKAHQVSPPGQRPRAALVLGIAYVGAGTMGAGRGSLEDCRKRCDYLLSRDDRLVSTRYVRATALLALDRKEQAMDDFRRGLKGCPYAGTLMLVREDLRLVRLVLPALDGLTEAEQWLQDAIEGAPRVSL